MAWIDKLQHHPIAVAATRCQFQGRGLCSGGSLSRRWVSIWEGGLCPGGGGNPPREQDDSQTPLKTLSSLAVGKNYDGIGITSGSVLWSLYVHCCGWTIDLCNCSQQSSYRSFECPASRFRWRTSSHTRQWRIQDFPRGGANSQKCYYFSIFCQKLHENERIWTPGGVRVPRAPLGSANARSLSSERS